MITTIYTPISIYSLFIAIFWSGIFTVIISVLRKNTFLLEHFSIYTLFALLAACMIRILLPLEMPFTYTFNSQKILPAIQAFLNLPLIKSPYITVNIGLIVIFLWFLPAILLIYRRIKKYLYFKHILDIIPASKDQNLYKIFDMADIHNKMPGVKIIVHASVKTPAVTGLLHPVIILPDINFNDNELLGIFIHEISHYKYRHCFVKLIMGFICAIFWWNPLFIKLSSELSHAMELQSDKDVYLNLNNSQTTEYLKVITKVIKNTNGKNTPPPCSCSILEEDNSEKLIQRFKMITENKYQNKKKLDLITVPLIITIFLLSYSFVIFPFSEPTYKDMMDDSIVVTNQYEPEYVEVYLVKTNNGYDLYNSFGKYIDSISPEDLSYLEDIKIYESKEAAEKEMKIK